MRSRRILFVNGWSSCHGGSSTSLIDIVTHIDRKQFDPIVLCPEPGELPRRLAELGVPVVLHSVRRLTKRTLISYALEVVWYRRWLQREGIALLHVNGAIWRPSVALAARLCSIPHIQHVRNVVRHARANWTFRWAQRIVTVSDAAGQALRNDEVFQNKTLTVYNAVDLHRFDNAGHDHRVEIGAGTRPVIGFVGHITPGKGVHTLIKAMPMVLQECPTSLLVIVGCARTEDKSGCARTKDKSYEQECRRLVQELGLASHIVFAGYRRDIPALMRTFHVFALATRAETFGKVVIEAMAAGCPVVASRVGGIPEIISDPSLGTLIPPDNPEATAAAILRYLADHKWAKEIGRAASLHVRRHFSMDLMIGRLESLYSEVLTESKSV